VALQKAREDYKHFSIFISKTIDTYTLDVAQNIPHDLSQNDAMADWADTTTSTFQTKVHPDTVYGSVYLNAKAVFTKCPTERLKLYGNMAGFARDITNRCGTVAAEQVVFECQRLATLNDQNLKPLPLFGQTTTMSSAKTIHDRNMAMYQRKGATGLEIRLAEAGDYCTPIWAKPVPKFRAMEYYIISPCTKNDDSKGNKNKTGLHKKRKIVVGDRTQVTNGMFGDVDKIMATNMNPSACDGHINEMMNSHMHFSCFIADIDLHVDSQLFESISRKHFTLAVERDSRSLIYDVFRHIIGEEPVADRVFASATSTAVHTTARAVADYNAVGTTKVGIHFHALLPDGIVFTSRACRDVTNILQIMRFKYPQTLGQQTGTGAAVFDESIYPQKQQGVKPRGHCLRGPHQSKQDGSCTLNLIGRHGDDRRFNIDPTRVWAHAPQFKLNEDGTRGQRILYGRVVEKINGIQDYRNEHYFRRQQSLVVKEKMDAVCTTDVGKIMDTMNAGKLIFHDSDDVDQNRDTRNKVLLLAITKDLWATSGANKLQKHLGHTNGADGYVFSSTQISLAGQTKIYYDAKKNTLNVVPRDSNVVVTNTFPFCPQRPHRSARLGQQKGIRLLLGFAKNMICFTLFVRDCFKSYCTTHRCNGHESKQFLNSVHLNMKNVFVSSVIESRANSFADKFRGPRVDMTDVQSADNDEAIFSSFFESTTVTTKHGDAILECIVHESNGVFHVLDKRNVVDSSNNFFMLLTDSDNKSGVLCVKVAHNNKYVLMHEDDFGYQKVFVSASAKLLCAVVENQGVLPTNLTDKLRTCFENE